MAYAFVFTGAASATREKLEKLGRQRAQPSRIALADAAEGAALAWSKGSAASVLVAMRSSVDALLHFSVDHDLGIFDAGHAELTGFTNDEVVYKPCGAGGGDIGMAMATNRDALASFAERAVASGFKTLRLVIDDSGVTATRENSA